MSDLVNRLRGQYQLGPDGIYGARDFSDFIPAISFEAADEIQHLQDALFELCWLKSIKDNQGKTDEYLRRQPLAWKAAFELLEKEAKGR